MTARPASAMVEAVATMLGNDEIGQAQARRCIAAMFDNLDREAMVTVVADFMAASTRAMREHMARNALDAAISAARTAALGK